MKRVIAVTSGLAFVAAAVLFAEPSALAMGKRPAARAASAPRAPHSEVFADAGRQLKLIGVPDYDGRGLALTLIYEDGEAARSVTIDPAEARGRDAAELEAFLDGVDPGFLSYVRASLADRILHLAASASDFQRAQVDVFFPGRRAGLDGAATVERRGPEASGE
jgi:hypothetical protein